MTFRKYLLMVMALICLLVTKSLSAKEPLPVFKLKLKNHLFSPMQLIVPAHTKIKLKISNQDKQAEEFDSFDLNREKLLYPGRTSILFIGPLKPGRYEYFGEYNPNIALGSIIAKEPQSILNLQKQQQQRQKQVTKNQEINHAN